MSVNNPTPEEVTEAVVERIQAAAVENGACSESGMEPDTGEPWNPKCGRANRQTLHYHLEELFKKFNETLLELRDKVKAQSDEIAELKNQNVRLRAAAEKEGGQQS
jgi:hypothetical protein